MRFNQVQSNNRELSDATYNGLDALNFPACTLCWRYSPFLFYVTSEAALAKYKEISEPQCNIFCTQCLPKETERDKRTGKPFYRTECLFNNEEFISLFEGYIHSNPWHKVYGAVDRLIITEDAKVNASYKKLLRTPMPKNAKLHRIFTLFQPVHRMPFERHENVVEVFKALRLKYEEIKQTYQGMCTSALHDHIDMLVDRTPLHERRSAQRTANDNARARAASTASNFPSDTFVLRTVRSDSSSDGNSASLGSSSQGESVKFSDESISVQNEVIVTSTEELELAAFSQSSFQPNISSQSVSSIVSNVILSESMQLTPLQPVMELFPDPNASISSSGSEIVLPRKHPPPLAGGIHDSQEAGPSGLQKTRRPAVAEPQPKRRRIAATPVNPSPTNFRPSMSTERESTRLPRLSGG